MPAYHNQHAFLANEQNKKSLVQALINHFHLVDLCVSQAVIFFIVGAAMEYARNDVSVPVGANYTDILVMLLYHFK